MGRPALQLQGRRFGRLRVNKLVGKNRSGHMLWRTTCDCGSTVTVTSGNLNNGSTNSCGCLRTPSYRYKDGRRSPEYIAFYNAQRRCTVKQWKQYSDYGGRGIKFLFRNFEEFYRHIGPRPSVFHTLDRIDNDGHYAIGNVQWATRKEQAMNRRKRSSCTAAK